ncbi:3975_t:CDS:2, partial [Funneliformis geosporum]
CTKGNKEVSFFTMPDDVKHMINTPVPRVLALQIPKEAKQYFKNLKRHKRPFVPMKEELILFSRADNERSIPISSLSGAVLEQAAYHHGDASLQGTIIGMAYDFVVSNNVNILNGEGQFGTRAPGGKDASLRSLYQHHLSPT